MAQLLVLEDSVITQMLRSQEIVAEFPFMTHMAQRVAPRANKGGCKPCQRKQRQNVWDYNGIKQAIANLPNSHKIRLKQILNAEKLRLYYTNHRGQKVKMTF